MKATEQYFPMVLSIMLYRVIVTLDSVGVILKCDYWYVYTVAFATLCSTIFYQLHSLVN